MLNDEIERKKQLRKDKKKQPELTCETRDSGYKIEIAS
jgi:hypothetical protein